ncbi:hypothetical protein [Paraburkholderia sp.]|uniref:hypothetical protein n=1 Tax=Paraburkholderia sp. TaxID=1926495 RepID=UPI0039E4830A
MPYLKNTLGGLSRSLADSAVNSFRGPHRWWKLALFAGLIVLPGGSVGVALLAWVEHRRETKRAKSTAAVAKNGAIARPVVLPEVVEAAKNLASTGTACQARGGASCRAAAGKLARRQGQQSKSAESRVEGVGSTARV